MADSKRTLLVVEDDQDVREAILDSIEHLDFEIITAVNGKEGLEKALLHRPTAILSDINMPLMTGLEFLAELRTQNIDTPFIVLTAFSDKLNTVNALRMGAFDFLEKPFDIDHLEKVVTTAIEAGVRLNLINEEISNIVAEKRLTEDQAMKIREAKKQILLMRYQSTTIQKAG